jgi:hypothetical protein
MLKWGAFLVQKLKIWLILNRSTLFINKYNRHSGRLQYKSFSEEALSTATFCEFSYYFSWMLSAKFSCRYFVDELCLFYLDYLYSGTPHWISDQRNVQKNKHLQSHVISFTETLRNSSVKLFCQKANWKALVKFPLSYLMHCGTLLLVAMWYSKRKIHWIIGCISSWRFCKYNQDVLLLSKSVVKWSEVKGRAVKGGKSGRMVKGSYGYYYC